MALLLPFWVVFLSIVVELAHGRKNTNRIIHINSPRSNDSKVALFPSERTSRSPTLHFSFENRGLLHLNAWRRPRHMWSPSAIQLLRRANANDCKLTRQSEACCEFSSWSVWSACSQTCTQSGNEHNQKFRFRQITVDLSEEGDFCSSEKLKTGSVVCGDEPCAKNCILSEWAIWTECSATCGKSQRYRVRDIVENAVYGGTQCHHLKLKETDDCHEEKPCHYKCDEHPCKNDGGCVNSPEESQGYKCNCKIGYKGENCEIGPFSWWPWVLALLGVFALTLIVYYIMRK